MENELCECGHPIYAHGLDAPYCKFCECPKYSPVSKNTINCPCQTWGSLDSGYLHGIRHHPLCDRAGNNVNYAATLAATEAVNASDTSLELTIIDFGKNCIVRVEKGVLDNKAICPFTICKDEMQDIVISFTELRAAIDAEDEKPVPRIEHIEGSSNYRIYSMPEGQRYFDDVILEDAYIALCELAGKTLEVYEPKERGEWTQLYNKNAVAMVGYSLPFDVWKYTR